MPFNQVKAQFNDADLTAGAAADAVYEALKDGVTIDDLTVILPQILPLFAYLKSEHPVEYANKLIALGVMVLRDNDILAPPPPIV